MVSSVESLAIGLLSGGVVAFAGFRSRWFFELALGMIGAGILCDLFIDGIDGYLSWMRLLIAELPRFQVFLASAVGGLIVGGIAGRLTRTAP